LSSWLSASGAQRALFVASVLLVALVTAPVDRAHGQESAIRYGSGVPAAVRGINHRCLEFLASTQRKDGSWPGNEHGAGISGICVMAFMASGEDPDFGPYATHVRRALGAIIADQNANTGHISGPGHGSMYHHGFAMLALSEAYGVVSDRLLWQGSEVPVERRRTIGQALELATRCALTAQEQNPWGAWRYSPGAQDADTTVSGTVLMGLLGARNAGIEVPNEAIDKALGFFKSLTREGGAVSYTATQSHGDGVTRSAIGTLVFAMAKRKDWPEYQAASAFIKKRMHQSVSEHPFYARYYMAQALFHSDLEAWEAWNQRTVQRLQGTQRENGSFSSSHGSAYGTGMSALALALNYRLLPVYER
jgi:hypothetical protein